MFTETLPAFFLDFGVAVTIGGTEGVAIFDNASNALLDGMVMSAGPTLTIRQADFAPSLVGATAVVQATNYRITSVEPDGTGIATLRLEKI